MNREELQQRIDEETEKYKARIAELLDEANKSAMKKILEEKQEPKMFPQEEDKYWTYNKLYPFEIYYNTANDSEGRLFAYRTKEEAEKQRDIEVAKMKLKHIIKVANDGWKPDWNNSAQNKFHFQKEFSARPDALSSEHTNTIDYMMVSRYKTKPNWMYMKSEEIAENILAKHRDLVELVEGEG